MATRISLLHSARQREERQQIGNMTTPFANSLKELEKRCLIRLSQAARGANQVQIALNSIMRAHKLYPRSSPEVSEEFANVLWEQGEQAIAIQYLQKVVNPLDQSQNCNVQMTTYRALLRARLVGLSQICEDFAHLFSRGPGWLPHAWKSRLLSGRVTYRKPFMN